MGDDVSEGGIQVAAAWNPNHRFDIGPFAVWKSMSAFFVFQIRE